MGRQTPNARRPAPLLLSVLLHAVVLVAVTQVDLAAPPELPPPAIPIELVGEDRAAAPGDEGPAGQPAPATPSPAAPAAIPPQPVPTPKPKPVPKQHSRLAVPPRPSEAAATPLSASLEPAASGSGSPVAGKDEGGGGGGSGGEDGGDPPPPPPPPPSETGMRAYLANLRQRIQQTLDYPAQARRLGLAGEVALHFTILADGRLALDTLRVIGGSDDSLLQDGALETIRRLESLPPPPDGALTVEVPVVFTLQRGR